MDLLPQVWALKASEFGGTAVRSPFGVSAAKRERERENLPANEIITQTHLDRLLSGGQSRCRHGGGWKAILKKGLSEKKKKKLGIN